MARRPRHPDPPAEDRGRAALAEAPSEANGTPPPHTPERPPPGATGTPPDHPVKTIALAVCDGVRIEGAIWPREVAVAGRPVVVYSATVRKRYRGEDGEFRHTTSFRGAEIPPVQYVLGRCAQWILDQRREEEPPF